MVKEGLPGADTVAWRAQLDTIDGWMDGPVATALDRERAVAAAFRELGAINSAISGQVQALIESRNTALQEQLGASRARLMQQVVLAIVIAVTLAFALGIWLARPFGRLEAAIAGLGENQLSQPIDIPGPSDVRRVSQRLEWLRLRLTELDEDKARFLRHVSHELKTPLAALREGVALLEDGVTGELNASQREVARILHQNTLALQRQIEALLRFNAAAFEARQLNRRPTDLLALLEEQAEAQRLQWRGRGLAVSVQGAPLTVPVDADKLGTAIANILSNAIRFSPAGSTIRMTLSQAPGVARIDIADAGPALRAPTARAYSSPFTGASASPRTQCPAPASACPSCASTWPCPWRARAPAGLKRPTLFSESNSLMHPEATHPRHTPRHPLLWGAALCVAVLAGCATSAAAASGRTRHRGGTHSGHGRGQPDASAHAAADAGTACPSWKSPHPPPKTCCAGLRGPPARADSAGAGPGNHPPGRARAAPLGQLQLAMALALTRVPSDLQRAQALLQRVLDNGSDEARSLHPLARLLAAQYAEQRRAEEATERQAQQLRDAQRRIDQLNDRLEAVRAIERSLSRRPAGAASAPRSPAP
jgi:signal transduction histidine kinase